MDQGGFQQMHPTEGGLRVFLRKGWKWLLLTHILWLLEGEKPRLRKERSKPRAHFDSVSVSGPKISPICTFPRGSRAGAKFQSFTKAAVGTFPTRNDHQKHLLHEEHLAAEQVFSVPDTERGNPKPCCFLVAKLS